MASHKGMHNPPHPGMILHELYMKPVKLTQQKLAAALGVSRKTVSEIVNERASITPEMALRLSLVFGSTVGLWMNMQANYDAWQVNKREKEIRREVTPLKLIAA